MRETTTHQLSDVGADKDSIRRLILNLRNWIKYLFSKIFFILGITLLWAFLGLWFATKKKPVYTATTNFVLEAGSKSNGLGAYAGIAANLGFNLGGNSGGLFEGDNILELYRSRTMISKALLSESEFNGKKQLLIDRYIEFSKLREQWKNNDALSNIKFTTTNQYSTPSGQLLHDSIISTIVRNIEKRNLSVGKKDKKLNIIYVTVVASDELFAKRFNEKLVEKVNDFYLETKTKRALENVAILQIKTDSVRGLLTGAINRAASIADATPNQNVTRLAQRVGPMQNARANAEINQEILGPLIQNLELSKVALLKETPLIQIVDSPILPLEKNSNSKLKWTILGGLLGCILTVGVLIVYRIFKSALRVEN